MVRKGEGGAKLRPGCSSFSAFSLDHESLGGRPGRRVGDRVGLFGRGGKGEVETGHGGFHEILGRPPVFLLEKGIHSRDGHLV
jgi:hypothetical protein